MAPSHGGRSECPDRPEGGPTGPTDLPCGAVRWAVEADVCGALGCRETSGLFSVESDGERRVLCMDHARGWVSA